MKFAAILTLILSITSANQANASVKDIASRAVDIQKKENVTIDVMVSPAIFTLPSSDAMANIDYALSLEEVKSKYEESAVFEEVSMEAAAEFRKEQGITKDVNILVYGFMAMIVAIQDGGEPQPLGEPQFIPVNAALAPEAAQVAEAVEGLISNTEKVRQQILDQIRKQQAEESKN